jgi:hypothetical protein
MILSFNTYHKYPGGNNIETSSGKGLQGKLYEPLESRLDAAKYTRCPKRCTLATGAVTGRRKRPNARDGRH